MDTLSDEIESILFIAREVMGELSGSGVASSDETRVIATAQLYSTVYQVPHRTTTSGYKAADWNVEAFLWKGRLRALEIGSRCELRLEVRRRSYTVALGNRI